MSPTFYAQLLRQLVYTNLTGAWHRAYNVVVEHIFWLGGMAKLDIVLLVKLNSAEECLLVHLLFGPEGW
jgi:hypothetical protein